MAESWKQALSSGIGDASALLREVRVAEDQVPFEVDFDRPFPVKVPKRYLRKIERGNPVDPLLMQVLPFRASSVSGSRYVVDPLQESRIYSGSGFLTKYSGRSLLLITGACAIHCQYCFRQHFSYPKKTEIVEALENKMTPIHTNCDIQEVILSGGDPLVMADEPLCRILDQLGRIDHLRTIRIHTRVPIVLPERLTPLLLHHLYTSPKRIIIVIHANHPREFDSEVVSILTSIFRRGIWLLNQSVLLKGVNDNLETLTALSEKLYEAHVLPYYLHLLDPVVGAEVFEVEYELARKLVGGLAASVPGYLVPRLVQEVPEHPSKTELAPIYGWSA